MKSSTGGGGYEIYPYMIYVNFSPGSRRINNIFLLSYELDIFLFYTNLNLSIRINNRNIDDVFKTPYCRQRIKIDYNNIVVMFFT